MTRLAGVARTHWIEVLVFVVALAARLGVILRRGGIHGVMGYDCGVYFAGADALIHGRMPYRDFTMLHPPVITLVLAPFAALTRWMSDWHAFIIATLAFCALGALNAGLVVVVCRRFGLTDRAAGLAGLFYAVWYGAISGEFEVKLSPVENVFLLLGLLLLLRAQRVPTGQTAWANVLAGAVLGLTMVTKIWWAVPVVLLVLWQARTQRSLRAGLQVALGAAGSAFAVCAPFFFADPSTMFASVVTEQLGRRRVDTAEGRVSSLTTLPDLGDRFSHVTVGAVDGVFVVLVVVVLLLAWRASKKTRVMVALVSVQLAVLFEAPSWFPYYSDYLTVGLAVCVGAAVSTSAGMRVPRLRTAPSIVLAAALLAVASLVTITGSMAARPFPSAARLTRAVGDVRCVTTTNTTDLIRLDALTRGLDEGCPDWIDVTGHRFDLPHENRPQDRAAWGLSLRHYLGSGGATVVPDGLPSSLHLATDFTRHGVVARTSDDTIYRGAQHPKSRTS
jgi:hypothetical protein